MEPSSQSYSETQLEVKWLPVTHGRTHARTDNCNFSIKVYVCTYYVCIYDIVYMYVSMYRIHADCIIRTYLVLVTQAGILSCRH